MADSENASDRPRRWPRAALPVAIFVLTAAVYAATLGPRAAGPSDWGNNHFSHLAESWLHGRLDVLVDDQGMPPGRDDWACYDTESGDGCPQGGAFTRSRDGYRWYISFPPFPAVVILPVVAVVGGTDFSDPLFWALFAGLAPAFLFLLLRTLRERGHSGRTPGDDLLLTTMFALGSVYYFTAVQGSVWFAAHVVATPLLILYLLFALDGKRPVLAGVALGLCFLTRPSTAPFALFFLFELLRTNRGEPPEEFSEEEQRPLKALGTYLRHTRWPAVVRPTALFFAPILVCGALAMAHNAARFGSPFEFGHRYLVIRWSGRIHRWGLFHYHYLSKNLAVVLASIPWFSRDYPYYVKISLHGLALWFTSPNLLWAVWPRRVPPLAIGLAIPTACVAFADLLYQNSGWVQFGYRFSLDYMPALIVLLAIGGRRFGNLFRSALAFAVVVNLIGAITFNRGGALYDDDRSQTREFPCDFEPRQGEVCGSPDAHREGH